MCVIMHSLNGLSFEFFLPDYYIVLIKILRGKWMKGGSVSCRALFFLFNFLLVYSCFAMLCSFLLYSKVKQIYIHTHTHTHIYPFLFLNFPPIQVTKEHWVEFPVLYSKFSLVMFLHFCFFFGFCHENVPWLACRRGIWEAQWRTNEGEFSQGYYQDKLTTTDQFTDNRAWVSLAEISQPMMVERTE